MSRPRPTRRGARARAAGLLALVSGTLLAVLYISLSPGAPRASGQGNAASVTAQTDASVPARNVVLLGSSPNEAPGETWGVGQLGALNKPTAAVVRYATGAGWSLGQMLDSQGRPLAGFAPLESPFTGTVTAGGAGALLGTITETSEEGQEHSRQVLLVRDPGGAFREVPAVPASLLGPGESLSGKNRAPLLAALDEGGGKAGALVVAVNATGSGVAENGVLHWDGQRWTREQIEGPAQAEGFRVLAIGASSPANAWLLGQLPAGGVALFRRAAGGSEAVWKPVAPAPGAAPGAPVLVDGEQLAVSGTGEPPTVKAQVMTVTDQGIWLDGERPEAHALVTLFFKPAGESQNGGQVLASWCNLPAGAPKEAASCTYGLPDTLPSGPARSFAWSDGSTPFGQRVITGLAEDVSLRLEGTSFTRVLALGGEEPGLGAAFSSPEEGWLGDARLPVHLTVNPSPSRLGGYPVPFRFALLAAAPQPGAAVGALSSQALAVGDNGEVARYAPGQGWQPESLLGPGGRRATPRLRGVAWPSPARAYAVGELGQMWLWRGETGLWEPDPAAPRNFRGDLLGVAFDPNNPGRGYAVGQQGVLLRYGKSWSQDALPAEVEHASFTSIAFAGSEAIVAFRVPHPQSGSNGASYTGGLLVNDGSGWRVDQAAGGALGADGIPWAVAGLPDGGAALSGQTLSGEPIVLERNGPGAPWQPPATPYPGFAAPGSLALFREGGALRVIGSGTIPNTRNVDFQEPPSPAGFPEQLIKPYPPTSGYILRQTASGWSDEEHGQNDATAPPGNYARYDLPFQPDPTAAVLIDPSGSSGWAVGGEIETAQEGELDTADIARYPADGVPPPGVGSAPVQTSGSEAVLAVGGDAQCAAPCADRANARLGPDLWLSSALAQAGAIPGVRAFMYMGPRVTTGDTLTGKRTREVPYEREFGRYASLLHGGPLQAFPVASATDIAGAAGECLFEQSFEDFPGAVVPNKDCSTQSAYYAFDSAGQSGPVRVIVLDEGSGVEPAQLGWLASELEDAAAHSEPALVFGEADLAARIAARDPSAIEVASTLVKRGGASAYFFDAPERNVQVPLRVGADSIPAFGSGTLGYALAANASRADFIGHSGFLLAQVKMAARDPQTLRWPVGARLIPNIGELALEAQDGVLLRRSQAALFSGLARRPRSGCLSRGGSARCETSPYVPIPANCVGATCATAILPEYTFSSSRTDIGDFVEPNLASPDPHALVLGPNDKPIHDEKSGLFCAYNAGTTVVTLSAGGLSSSLTVTVQAGSVRRPCGTQPLSEVQGQQASVVAPTPPPPAPAPASPAPAGSPTPPIPVPVPAPAPPSVPAPSPPPPVHPAPANFFVPPVPLTPTLAFVPPPVPTPARPTPPSGTSAVTSPIEVAEREEEEEEATESVSNQAMAYRAADHEPAPAYVLGLIVLAAFAGASARLRIRRRRRELRIAPATVAASRWQRRVERSSRRGEPW